MSTIIDKNADALENVKQIKTNVIDTIQRMSEKSASDSNYDKTILATVQCCSDASLGQYKVKYQNSYFTAYSKDLMKTYMNNAAVYVLIPGNDTSNRMFITGLATDNSGQQKSINNLELDQQFTNKGPNFITIKDGADLNMLTYWCAGVPEGDEYVIQLYHVNNYDYENLLTVDQNKFMHYVNQLDNPYIRLGCAFKTNIEDERKHGDYGIRIRLRYKNDIFKDYIISTETMTGSPFNFTAFVNQYNIWEIDKNELEGIESIESFMSGFPDGTRPEDPDTRDIFLNNLTLTTCQRVYNQTDDNSIQLAILYENGNVFGDRINGGLGSNAVYRQLPFEAQLLYHGNIIDNTTNGLEVYWGREDATVTSVDHPKYNEALGFGWYCLNTANRKKLDSEDIGEDGKIAPDAHIIYPENTSNQQGDFEWNSQPKIIFSQDLFRGKETKIKCVAKYENHFYPETATVINKTGLFLLAGSAEGKTSFINSNGSITLVAGLFEDADSDKPIPHINEGSFIYKGTEIPFTVEYKWSKEDEGISNIRKALPVETSENYPISPKTKDGTGEWDSEQDNEKKTDEEIETYFSTYFSEDNIPIAKRCKPRYNAYLQKYNELIKANSDDPVQVTYRERCYNRLYSMVEDALGIIPANKEYIKTLYADNNNNEEGQFIVGSSSFDTVYDTTKTATDTDFQNYYQYASIVPGTTVYSFYGSGGYEANLNNTLYKVRGSSIFNYSNFYVTAFIKYSLDGVNTITESIGTKCVTLTNRMGVESDYYLEIVNGERIFNYDEAGKLDKDTEFPTLSFQLYARDGELLFDSANAESNNQNDINLTVLQPRWKFPFQDTMLHTFYTPTAEETGETNINCIEEDGFYVLLNQPYFDFEVSDYFNRSYVDNNITLEVIYNDATISTSTNFTIMKQGDLGTNGTDYTLLIQDPVYEEYKNTVLNLNQWSMFDGKRVSPNNRHLQNVRLYGINLYDKNGTQCYDFGGDEHGIIYEPRYTEMYFKRNSDLDGNKDKDTVLQMQIYENGSPNTDDNHNITWDYSVALNQQDKKFVNSFSFDTESIENSKNGKIQIINDDVRNHTYVPGHWIETATNNGQETNIEYTTNNVIRVKADVNVQYESGEILTKSICNYYGIPFYYFGRYQITGEVNGVEQYDSTNTLADHDPATHIVLTGGYDSVLYNITGSNPIYNKRDDFQLHIFDEDYNDITQDLHVEAGGDSNITDVHVYWNVSSSFQKIKGETPQDYDILINQIVQSKDSILGKRCIYNNQTYECIHQYDPNQQIVILDKMGTQNKTYASKEFIPSFWQKIKINELSCKIEPTDTYGSNVNGGLFDNWVSVNITFKKDNYLYLGKIFLPINVINNPYGSQILNDWDGKSLQINDTDNYILTSTVFAGHKTADNHLVGVNIGDNLLTKKENDVITDTNIVTGLFGYGRINSENVQQEIVAQTLFMDANTGCALFGDSTTNQILLDPRQDGWSKINGWLFNKDYFFKQTCPTTVNTQDIMNKAKIQPKDEDEEQRNWFYMYDSDNFDHDYAICMRVYYPNGPEDPSGRVIDWFFKYYKTPSEEGQPIGYRIPDKFYMKKDGICYGWEDKEYEIQAYAYDTSLNLEKKGILKITPIQVDPQDPTSIHSYIEFEQISQEFYNDPVYAHIKDENIGTEVQKGEYEEPYANGFSGGFYIPTVNEPIQSSAPFLWLKQGVRPIDKDYKMQASRKNDADPDDIRLLINYQGQLFANDAYVQGHIDALTGNIGPLKVRESRLTVNGIGSKGHQILFQVNTEPNVSPEVRTDNTGAHILLNGSVYMSNESIAGDIDKYIIQDYDTRKPWLEPGDFDPYKEKYPITINGDYAIRDLRNSAYENPNLLFFHTKYFPMKYSDSGSGLEFNYGEGASEQSFPTTLQTDYLVLNKNFSIFRPDPNNPNKVNVFINGEMNVQKGKIGPWELDEHELGNYEDGVWLHAAEDSSDHSRLRIGYVDITSYPEKYFITMEDTGDFWCSTAYMGSPSNPSFIPDSRKTPDGGGVPPEANFNKNSQTRYELRPDGTAILNQSDNSIFRGRVFSYNSSQALGVNTLDWWGLHLGSEAWYPDHSSPGRTVAIYLGTEDYDGDDLHPAETCVPGTIRPVISTNGCCTNGHLQITNALTVKENTSSNPAYVKMNIDDSGNLNGQIAIFSGGEYGTRMTILPTGIKAGNGDYIFTNDNSGSITMYPDVISMNLPAWPASQANVSNAVLDNSCRFPSLSEDAAYEVFQDAVTSIVKSILRESHLVNGISTSSTGSTPVTSVSWTFYNG